MIQELLGGGSATPPTGFFGERKISIPFSSSSTCPSTTPLLTTTNTTIVMNTPNSSNTGSSTGGGSGVATANNNNNNNNNNNSSETNNNSSQNLRCPRCDSTNTKFCYYNNYNLTQPRHFCKTCRRYWTKGGTLRNVPIGGGCRKNKPTISSSSASSATMSKSSTPTHHHFMAKAKANLSSEMLVNENNSSLFLGNGLLDHPLQTPGPSPILWPSFPQAQNSHIMALLRGGSTPFSNLNPNPNPNPNSNPSTTTTSSVFTSLGLDSYGHNNGAPSLLGSFTRSNQNQLNGFGPDFGENNNGGGNILDLYQRLKSSSNYGYCGGNENPGAVILGNMLGSSTSSMSSTILDATPLSAGGGGDHMGGGYGFMNTSPAISSWSDFPAVPINGAYP